MIYYAQEIIRSSPWITLNKSLNLYLNDLFFFEKTPNGNVFFEPDTVLHVGLKTITNCHYSSVERMKIWGYEMYILLAVNRSLTFVHANNDCSNSRIITLNSQSMIESCSILENLFVSLSK